MLKHIMNENKTKDIANERKNCDLVFNLPLTATKICLLGTTKQISLIQTQILTKTLFILIIMIQIWVFISEKERKTLKRVSNSLKPVKTIGIIK